MSLAIFSSANFVASSGLAAIAGSSSVEVRRESDNGLASIYSDVGGSTPLGNPFTADSEGRFAFYAAGLSGGYKITVTKDASTHTLRNVAIGTAAQLDASAYIATLFPAADAPAARDVLELESHDIFLQSLYGPL